MSNAILPTTQPTQPETNAPTTEPNPQTPALLPSHRAADILLQEMQLLLDQSKSICAPDNALALGPNEKARILCAMAEAITSGASTIATLKRSPSRNRNLHNRSDTTNRST